MFQELARFVHDDAGPELVEWAVITVIILVATLAVLVVLRGAVTDTLANLFQALADDTLTDGLPRRY